MPQHKEQCWVCHSMEILIVFLVIRSAGKTELLWTLNLRLKEALLGPSVGIFCMPAHQNTRLCPPSSACGDLANRVTNNISL